MSQTLYETQQRSFFTKKKKDKKFMLTDEAALMLHPYILIKTKLISSI